VPVAHNGTTAPPANWLIMPSWLLAAPCLYVSYAQCPCFFQSTSEFLIDCFLLLSPKTEIHHPPFSALEPTKYICVPPYYSSLVRSVNSRFLRCSALIITHFIQNRSPFPLPPA